MSDGALPRSVRLDECFGDDSPDGLGERAAALFPRVWTAETSPAAICSCAHFHTVADLYPVRRSDNRCSFSK
jgi:hypothetical protein